MDLLKEKPLSLFSKALRMMLDDTGLYTRNEWAEILGVKEEVIEEWISSDGLPTPENLRSIRRVVHEHDRTPPPILSHWEEMAKEHGSKVHPYGQRFGRSVAHYMVKPILEGFMRTLRCLSPKDAEEVLLNSAEMCRTFPPFRKE